MPQDFFGRQADVQHEREDLVGLSPCNPYQLVERVNHIAPKKANPHFMAVNRCIHAEQLATARQSSCWRAHAQATAVQQAWQLPKDGDRGHALLLRED